MSEQKSPVEKTIVQGVADATSKGEVEASTRQKAVEFLREIQENVGQISELDMEEKMLVGEFFASLLKILKRFGRNIQISALSLPSGYKKRVSHACLYPTGHLVLVYVNNKIELIDLKDPKNRIMLYEITGEVMMRLRDIINLHRSHVEKRVKFLTSITKELQQVANVFSSEENSKS
jgi:hypothetical protein